MLPGLPLLPSLNFDGFALDSIVVLRAKSITMKLAGFCLALALGATAFGQQKSEAIPHDTGSDLLWKKLETRVEESADRLDGVIGVAILDLTDGRILLQNADRVFPAASSIKLAILLELYRQDEQARAGAKGKAKLNDVTPSIPKIWSKTAGSWVVSLPV